MTDVLSGLDELDSMLLGSSIQTTTSDSVGVIVKVLVNSWIRFLVFIVTETREQSGVTPSMHRADSFADARTTST